MITKWQILGTCATDKDCSEFLPILCEEICKDENNELYKEINMLSGIYGFTKMLRETE